MIIVNNQQIPKVVEIDADGSPTDSILRKSDYSLTDEQRAKKYKLIGDLVKAAIDREIKRRPNLSEKQVEELGGKLFDKYYEKSYSELFILSRLKN